MAIEHDRKKNDRIGALITVRNLYCTCQLRWVPLITSAYNTFLFYCVREITWILTRSFSTRSSLSTWTHQLFFQTGFEPSFRVSFFLFDYCALMDISTEMGYLGYLRFEKMGCWPGYWSLQPSSFPISLNGSLQLHIFLSSGSVVATAVIAVVVSHLILSGSAVLIFIVSCTCRWLRI